MLTLTLTTKIYAASIDDQAAELKTIDVEITDPNEIIQYVKNNFEQNTVVVNELDYIKQLRSLSKEELCNLGCTEEEAQEIVSYDYNQILLDLGDESSSTLQKKGYSPEQIDSIKSYDGLTDAISYASVNSLSNANLTFDWGPTLINNTNQFNIYYYAEWSSAPTFVHTDIVALGWVACNSSSLPIGMRHREAPTCIAQYYSQSDQYYCTSQLYDTQTTGSTATINVNMNNGRNYAKYISGSVKLLTQSDSNNLYTIQIAAAYGHTVVTMGSPSVSFSYPSGVSVGISFSYQLQDLYNESRTYKYNGTVQ